MAECECSGCQKQEGMPLSRVMPANWTRVVVRYNRACMKERYFCEMCWLIVGPSFEIALSFTRLRDANDDLVVQTIKGLQR